MKIDYVSLKNEVINILKENKTWVLSTSLNDEVSSRSMSIINIGLDIYFQTNKCYIKHKQMTENNNVALCFKNVSIVATVEEIGSWKDDKNKELMELYKSTHLSSFNAYGLLEGQVVYKVTPKLVKLWKYVDAKPIRQQLDVINKSAEQLDFM